MADGGAQGRPAGSSRDADVWAHYRRTLLRIAIGGRTLSVRPVPEVGEVSRGPWPFDRPLVVVTAWNPGSVARGQDANRRAQALLERELRAAGYELLAAEGVGEDSGWAEPSIAVVGLELPEALAVGVRHGQRALYRLDDAAVEIVGCLDVGRYERWPRHSSWEPG